MSGGYLLQGIPVEQGILIPLISLQLFIVLTFWTIQGFIFFGRRLRSFLTRLDQVLRLTNKFFPPTRPDRAL